MEHGVDCDCARIPVECQACGLEHVDVPICDLGRDARCATCAAAEARDAS